MAAPAFERSCVACRARAPKAALRRFVVSAGTIVADPARVADGRGAYLCDRCEPTRSIGALRRALRAPGADLTKDVEPNG